MAWARNNRSALVRVPVSKKGKDSSVRLEYRSPDPACNPYLAFSVILAAGLEGIRQGYELPEEAAANIFEMDAGESAAAGIAELPQSLSEALDAMENSTLVADALGRTHLRVVPAQQARRMGATTRPQVTPFELSRYLPTW